MRCTEVADRPLPDGKFNCRDIGDRGRSAMVVITLCDPATVSHSKKFHENMRVIVATFVAMTALAICGSRESRIVRAVMADEAMSDDKAIVGIWEVIKARLDGEILDRDVYTGTRYKFDGTTVTLFKTASVPQGPTDATYLYKLDESTNPKQLVFTAREETRRRKIDPTGFIYKLHEDSLVLCGWNIGRMPPPTRFESKHDEGQMLFELRRVRESSLGGSR